MPGFRGLGSRNVGFRVCRDFGFGDLGLQGIWGFGDLGFSDLVGDVGSRAKGFGALVSRGFGVGDKGGFGD